MKTNRFRTGLAKRVFTLQDVDCHGTKHGVAIHRFEDWIEQPSARVE